MSEFREFAYDCKVSGCFNEKHRLDFGIFFDCLPGAISFTDHDACVDVNRCLLYIEMKSTMDDLSWGQHLHYKLLTELSRNCVVFIICGDVATRTFHAVRFFSCGILSEWHPTSLEDIRETIKLWVKWTAQPRVPVIRYEVGIGWDEYVKSRQEESCAGLAVGCV